ncbi:unnamed protein product [Discosporangium mesarthrocarpum]
MEDPRQEAQKYIAKKGIGKLFQELGMRVMYHRPQDPNSFLLEVLQNLCNAKKEGTPTTFFTEQDLEGMFSLFDPTQRGHISPAQYEQALKTLGIDTVKFNIPSGNRITKQQFKECM